jgi:hypothetical protein
MQLSLRQVVTERAENVPVANFEKLENDHAYKLQTTMRLKPGTYCVYATTTPLLIDSDTNCIAVYTCDTDLGCKLQCYRLKRQRLWPVFTLDTPEQELYLVMGETLLHCQALIEEVTHVKVIASP